MIRWKKKRNKRKAQSVKRKALWQEGFISIVNLFLIIDRQIDRRLTLKAESVKLFGKRCFISVINSLLIFSLQKDCFTLYALRF
jgi:hypothetical protein